MTGRNTLEPYFLLQNMRWVEKLRHSNRAHIFFVRKLLCKTQRHVCVCFFSEPINYFVISLPCAWSWNICSCVKHFHYKESYSYGLSFSIWNDKYTLITLNNECANLWKWLGLWVGLNGLFILLDKYGVTLKYGFHLGMTI